MPNGVPVVLVWLLEPRAELDPLFPERTDGLPAEEAADEFTAEAAPSPASLAMIVFIISARSISKDHHTYTKIRALNGTHIFG